MAVRLIPCRHKETGAEAEIPETGLQHLPAYVPVDEDDRKRLGFEAPADSADNADSSTTGEDTTSKPATGAAKMKKEHTRGD